MALTMSDHFRRRWTARVGHPPTMAVVLKVIKEGVKLCHCRDLLEKDGVTPFRQLAWYWHPPLGVVVSVDHISRHVVSVLSLENFHPEKAMKCTAKPTTAR